MDSYLLGAPVAGSDILAVLQPLQDLLYRGQLISRVLLLQAVATWTGLLLLGLKGLLNKLNVLEPQLLGNDVQVTGRIHVTLDVDDLCIVEATDHLEYGIDGTNVRQESVAQTSTSGCTAGQTGNIVDGQVCGDAGLWLVLLNQPVVTVIRDDDARLLGVNGGVGEVGGVAKVAPGDGLEEGRLSDVCKADLKECQRTACGRERSVNVGSWGMQKLTMPLFKLLPGRPRRIFSSLTCFLGAIFFLE